MQHPQDLIDFTIALERLEMVSTVELTKERVTVYEDALMDLPIEGIVLACQHLARYWTPTSYERFPTPATIRETLRGLRAEQRMVSTAPRLMQRTEASYDEGKAAIRDILAQLERTPRPSKAPVATASLNPPDPRRWQPLVEDDGRPYTEKRGSTLRPLIETAEENPYAERP